MMYSNFTKRVGCPALMLCVMACTGSAKTIHGDTDRARRRLPELFVLCGLSAKECRNEAKNEGVNSETPIDAKATATRASKYLSHSIYGLSTLASAYGIYWSGGNLFSDTDSHDNGVVYDNEVQYRGNNHPSFTLSTWADRNRFRDALEAANIDSYQEVGDKFQATGDNAVDITYRMKNILTNGYTYSENDVYRVTGENVPMASADHGETQIFDALEERTQHQGTIMANRLNVSANKIFGEEGLEYHIGRSGVAMSGKSTEDLRDALQSYYDSPEAYTVIESESEPLPDWVYTLGDIAVVVVFIFLLVCCLCSWIGFGRRLCGTRACGGLPITTIVPTRAE